MSILDRYTDGWIEDNQTFEFLKGLSNIEVGGYRLYDGHGSHLMQNPGELEDLLQVLVRLKCDLNFTMNKFLEFGWSTGISHTILNKVLGFKESVAVDIVDPCGVSFETFFANLRFKNLTFIANDSTSDFTLQKLQSIAPFDLVFIDGGHDYSTVKSDFETALKVVNKKAVIALHDIHAELPCEIQRFWNEIQDQYSTLEIYDSSQTINYGIGLIGIGIDTELVEVQKSKFRFLQKLN